MHAKSHQLCLTLCNPMDYSLPGSSVQEILQARILEWVAMPSSRDFTDPGIKPTSLISCIGRWVLYHWCYLGIIGDLLQAFNRTHFENQLTFYNSVLSLSLRWVWGQQGWQQEKKITLQWGEQGQPGSQKDSLELQGGCILLDLQLVFYFLQAHAPDALRWGWDDLEEWHWNMYNIIYETNHQSRSDAGYRMLRTGALGWPRGMVWGGWWEGGSGWGTRVHLWHIHADVWQNQYNIVK